MRGCRAVLLLGLVSWVGPAGAEGLVSHALTVTVHPAVQPSLPQSEIETILKGASDILQGNTNIGANNNCKVEFTFKGFIPFPSSSAPADINNATDLEQVQELPGDVKVVQNITYCAEKHGTFAGCAWRANGLPRTMIVARSQFSSWLGNGPEVWAHEYGHTTGLIHRYEQFNESLMSPCVLEAFSLKIKKSECAHFRAGRVTKYRKTSGPACPSGNPND